MKHTSTTCVKIQEAYWSKRKWGFRQKLQDLAHGEKESKWCWEMKWLPHFLAWHHSGYFSSVFQVKLPCKHFLDWTGEKTMSSCPENVVHLFPCWRILSLGLEWDGFLLFSLYCTSPFRHHLPSQKGWFCCDHPVVCSRYRILIVTTLCPLFFWLGFWAQLRLLLKAICLSSGGMIQLEWLHSWTPEGNTRPLLVPFAC